MKKDIPYELKKKKMLVFCLLYLTTHSTHLLFKTSLLYVVLIYDHTPNIFVVSSFLC